MKDGNWSLRRKTCCSTTSPHCPCELTLRLAPKSRLGWVARLSRTALLRMILMETWFEKNARNVRGRRAFVRYTNEPMPYSSVSGVCSSLFSSSIHPALSCFLKVKQSVFRMRVGLTSLKLVSRFGHPIQFRSVPRRMPRCSSIPCRFCSE